MLNIFRTTKVTATIPKYDQGQNHDSIDLQIKSLLYVFKRLRINRLAGFLSRHDNVFKYTNDYTEENQAYFQKLDQLYNVDQFISVICNDEYRIMVDFIKNKFRSWCIVSSVPSNLSQKADGSGLSPFPPFVDYKDRPVSKFKFILLTLDTTVDTIANTLTQSDIYYEHFSSFDFSERHRFALDAIRKVIVDDRFDPVDEYKQITITEDEKAAIIRLYLEEMAFNVQLNRIYSESVKQLSPSKPTIPRGHILSQSSQVTIPRMKSTADIRSSSVKTSRPSSPTKTSRPASPIKDLTPRTTLSTKDHTSRPSSPVKGLNSRSSTPHLNSRSSSPVKQLKSKPSISKLQLHELYSSAAPAAIFDTSDSKSDSTSDTSFDSLVVHRQPVERVDIYEKCKTAIKLRLKQEKDKLQ